MEKCFLRLEWFQHWRWESAGFSTGHRRWPIQPDVLQPVRSSSAVTRHGLPRGKNFVTRHTATSLLDITGAEYHLCRFTYGELNLCDIYGIGAVIDVETGLATQTALDFDSVMLIQCFQFTAHLDPYNLFAILCKQILIILTSYKKTPSKHWNQWLFTSLINPSSSLARFIMATRDTSESQIWYSSNRHGSWERKLAFT